MQQPFRLKVLTFNIWALPVAIPGADLRRRSELLPKAIAALDVDLVALQEAFHAHTRRTLLSALGHGYACHRDALATRRVLGLLRFDTTGGLLSFSRYPIVRQRCVTLDPPSDARFTEKLARKGVLLLIVKTPVGEVAFANLHFHAGPEARSVRIRREQYRALNRLVDELPATLPLIVAGDFNTFTSISSGRRGHVARSREIEPMIEAGFVDTAGVGDHGLVPTTYAAGENRFTKLWYHGSDADQRFDHVFYRRSEHHEIVVERTAIVFDNPGRPLSDHYGVMTELLLSKRSH
ncbi:MAG: endonuclease/exonuclease/phosphatase family protein [Gemmatimonadales bacterium]